jgi:tRNA modification GTPase
LDVAAVLQRSREQVEALLAQAGQGLVYREGVQTAIVGRPNVGKSSLLNALLRTSRAIVSPLPGTTRDTVEETLNLRGIPLCLIDTAGITDSTDVVEKLGIARSHQALQQADLVLLVLDGSEPLQPEDQQIAELVRNRTVIAVVNKSDLAQVAEHQAIRPQAPHVVLSALTGEGLAALEDAIEQTVFAGQAQAAELPGVSNPRHSEILHRALSQITAAQHTCSSHGAADLLAVDLTAAASALGEITGETVSEDVLETIFGSFCVGK